MLKPPERFRRKLGTLAALTSATAVLTLLAACSSNSATSSSSSPSAASSGSSMASSGSSGPASTMPSSGAVVSSSAAQSPGSSQAAPTSVAKPGEEVPLSAIPASVRDNYAGYQLFSKLWGNGYANWTPPPPPWKFCESTSYSGNTWEQGTQAEFTKLVKDAQAMGLAKGDLTVVDSNGTIALQISQLNSLVADGCNVVFSVPGSPTAMCPAITSAAQKGVLFITDDTPIECKDGINVSFNGYQATFLGTQAVAKALNGKGNIIAVTGIPGAVGTIANKQGLTDALKAYPDIKLLGYVEGDWTGSVAQTATSRFLATHPQQVDGIVDFGAMGVSAELALQQAGRPLAVVNSFESSCSELAFLKANPSKVAITEDQGPVPAAWETFHVAMRMLNGQKPIVNTIFYPIPGPTTTTIDQWYDPSMTIKSTCFATPPGGKAVDDSTFDPLFVGGDPVTKSPTP